jgi:hypothetical protein
MSYLFPVAKVFVIVGNNQAIFELLESSKLFKSYGGP